MDVNAVSKYLDKLDEKNIDLVKSLQKFLVKHVTRESDGIISVKQLYDEYIDFCTSGKHQAISKRKFTMGLKFNGITVRRGGGNILKVYGVESDWF